MKKIFALAAIAASVILACSPNPDPNTANSLDTDTANSPEPTAEVNITINLTDANGIGKEVGTIKAEDIEYGLLLTPNLAEITPGIHGFHVHENPDCGPAEKEGKVVPGLAAGGHYDPENTGKHEGPYGNGHLGDLPPLIVDAEGFATIPTLAPRLKVSDLKGRSLMIHMHGDNYSDNPKPLGGGGPRLACGVIE